MPGMDVVAYFATLGHGARIKMFHAVRANLTNTDCPYELVVVPKVRAGRTAHAAGRVQQRDAGGCREPGMDRVPARQVGEGGCKRVDFGAGAGLWWAQRVGVRGWDAGEVENSPLAGLRGIACLPPRACAGVVHGH